MVIATVSCGRLVARGEGAVGASSETPVESNCQTPARFQYQIRLASRSTAAGEDVNW
jgi:hypothetical protein